MENIGNFFAANLKKFRGARKQKEFAEFLGVANASTYHRYEQGRLPGEEILSQIANRLGITVAALISPPGSDQDKRNATVIGDVEFRKIPVVSLAAAGRMRDFQDLCHQMEEMIDSDCKDKNAFAVVIEGNSMAPRFLAGERIVLNPNGRVIEGKPVAVKTEEGEVLFKIFHETNPNEIMLESINPAWPPITLKKSKVKWIYPAWGRVERF